MNRKFFVSIEAAKLLKEKGYDERHDYVYAPDGRIISLKMLSNWSDDYLSAPTKAEAIDWLDSKGKIIEVLQDYRGQWFYVIKESCVGEDDVYSSTRLEAEEAAIIKALTLL